MDYTTAFEKAMEHVMLYEIGGFFTLTADVIAGNIETDAQKKACGYVNDPTKCRSKTIAPFTVGMPILLP